MRTVFRFGKPRDWSITMEAYKRFKELRKKQQAYAFVLGIAGWDSQTEAPKAAIPLRAEMISEIAGEAFA